MKQPIRLLVADTDMKFVASLQKVLQTQTGIRIVSLARDGQGAVDSCLSNLPDVVLMDLHLPVLDSVKAIRAIITNNERTKILVTSDQTNDRYAVEAVKAGACGFIEKNGDAGHTFIIDAIYQVANGEPLLNSSLANSILEEFHRLTD